MPGKPLDSVRRLRWFKEARFGMFVHWGLYSQLGRFEWAMQNERIPIREYEKLADAWRPKPRCMRQWARLARDAGMKYMVMIPGAGCARFASPIQNDPTESRAPNERTCRSAPP